MMKEKPANIEEYKEWLRKQFDIELSNQVENRYNSVVNKIKKDFEVDQFWIQLNRSLQDYNDEYHIKQNNPLFMELKTPCLETKSYSSFILKTFRKNILDNENWPNEPSQGWILPTNWFSKIKDTVRTSYIVKYIDGVQAFAEKIKLLSDSLGLTCDIDFEAREEGYYAAHVYLTKQFEITKIDWDTEFIAVVIEIQITTQLQDVIRKLLHKYYEQRRRNTPDESKQWQWDYRSDEFAANYLGHILHYVEGMIIDIRERQKGGIK